MSTPILDFGVLLGDGRCAIKLPFQASYAPSKTYLGVNESLRQNRTTTLTFSFASQDDSKRFIKWWEIKTLGGALNFYCKLPIYDNTKFYLLNQLSELKHTKATMGTAELTATFKIVENRTTGDNVTPIANPASTTVYEGSSDNTIQLTGTDLENDPLTFVIDSDPLHGTASIANGNILVYTPAFGYSGSDAVIIKAFDGIDYSEPVSVDITVLPRECQSVVLPDGANCKSITIGGKCLSINK